MITTAAKSLAEQTPKMASFGGRTITTAVDVLVENSVGVRTACCGERTTTREEVRMACCGVQTILMMGVEWG